ncbi:DMT family transporter [Aestuariivirga sp.]|uniref:DMT family transporter n=1 Tax=Aestuariivirga sp. TaxID=2650926 RepID=UPI0039E2B433
MSTQQAQRTGLLLLIAGSAVDSTSGLFTRLIAADGFTTASARGLFAFLTLFLVLLWRDRRSAFASIAAIGLWGFSVVGINAAGMVLNMLSLKYTAVANFFMIFATAPFAAAVAAWLILGEKLDSATLLAALAGFIGIAVMMFSGARAGGLPGDLFACAAVACYAAIVLIIRKRGNIDVLPMICATTLASCLIGLPFADFGQLTLGAWGGFAVFGAFQLALGNMLIFNAVPRIPAAQSGLLGILNAGFAPLWVFLFLGEVPPTATLIGGAIIIGAALTHLAWTLTRPVPQPAQPEPMMT